MVQSIEKINLVDGRYFAIYSGNELTITLPDWVEKPIQMNEGARGVSKAIVIVKDGLVYIENYTKNDKSDSEKLFEKLVNVTNLLQSQINKS